MFSCALSKETLRVTVHFQSECSIKKGTALQQLVYMHLELLVEYDEDKGGNF